MKKHSLLSNIVLFGFLLGIYEGKIALWQDNKEDPVQVFPYQASMLPEADQQMLRRGIHVDSIRELYRLIEDYFS